MPYSRQRPRLAPSARITIRLNTEQRDLFIRSAGTPKDLSHALHRAPVRDGKLSIRLTRASLDTLIEVAARSHAPDKRAERSLAALLGYLEALSDRFADPEDHPGSAEPPPEPSV